MSLFQGILLGVFIIAIIGGVLLFGIVHNDETAGIANLTMWGTLDEASVNALFAQIYNNNNEEKYRVSYVYKNPDEFDNDFLEALANGTPPDMVLLPHQDIFKQAKRLYPIPYKSYPQRTFKDTFIEEGELFLGSEGVTAIPFTIDPMVMYWNRTLFSKALISRPPVYWDELISQVSRLTEKDSGGNVKKSAIALGEWNNIAYVKDIISLLLMQAGSPIVGVKDGRITALIDERGTYTVAPSDTAITFFIQFANPVKAYYSWSRSFPNSIDHFANGDVAMLLARASDVGKIQRKNPNLNFDVAETPMPRGDAVGAITYGQMYGIGIVKNSKNVNSSVGAAYELASKEVLEKYEVLSGLPPVRRDMLATLPEDAFKSVFYRAALRSRAWYDPDSDRTETILKNMIETVISGREGTGGAAKTADEELNLILDELFVGTN